MLSFLSFPCQSLALLLLTQQSVLLLGLSLLLQPNALGFLSCTLLSSFARLTLFFYLVVVHKNAENERSVVVFVVFVKVVVVVEVVEVVVVAEVIVVEDLGGLRVNTRRVEEAV